jgi:hypothetical protein
MSDKLTLNEFSLGLMAALRAKETDELYVSPRREPHVHECFRKAYEVVEKRLGSQNLDFVIRNTGVRGTSEAVDEIFYYWETGWAIHKLPGWTWRFTMTDRAALQFITRLTGGADMYLEAADAFLEHYNSKLS